MAENSISYGMGLSDQMINQMLQSDDPSIVAQAQDYINQAQTQQEEKPSILQKIADFFNVGKAGASEPDKITLPNYGTGFNTVLDSSGGLRYVPIEQPKGIMVPASETNQLDLVNEINQRQKNIGVPMTLEETMSRSIVPPDPKNFQSIFPTENIAPLDMNRFQGVSDMSIIDETTNDEQDQEYIDQVDENNQSGILKALRSLPGPFNMILDMLKGEDPAVTSTRNFYRNQYGLTNAGSLASGIMRGYNPVSGGLFGQPISYGLANAARDRINRIAGRRAPQTAASRARIQQLQDFARADTIKRGRELNPDVYKRAEDLGLIDKKTGGFKSAGTNSLFSNTSGRGRTGY